MDGSWVTQSIDSLWFYTNILTCRDEPVASLTDQFAPSIHAQEPPKRDLEKPNSPFLLNQQNESQNVENLTPKCPKCGEISSASEAERVVPKNPEMVKSGRETEKRGRSKRRKWNRARLNGMKVILGGLDLGFDIKEVTGQTKIPPLEDDVAMKEHLKSWAYAVACAVK